MICQFLDFRMLYINCDLIFIKFHEYRIDSDMHVKKVPDRETINLSKTVKIITEKVRYLFLIFKIFFEISVCVVHNGLTERHFNYKNEN